MANIEASPVETINVVNPDNEVVSLPKAQLNDALQSGYQLAAPEQVQTARDQQQYGEGLTNQLKAFGAGAARSASFGLSDQFLTRSGAVKPETLSKLKQYNPVSSGAGEVAGVVGSVLAAPELSPVGLLGGAGEAVAHAAEPVASGIVGAVADSTASPIINKLVGRAIQGGAGGAIEGAAYGLGQSVSDNALGDPDAMGEKLLSNIGISGLFGGALGSMFGTFGAGIGSKEANAAEDALRSQGLSAPAAEGVASNGLKEAIDQAPQEEQQGLVEGLKKRKDNADEIEAAAQRLGVDAPEGMTTASEAIQKMEGGLLKGVNETDIKRQQLYQKGYEAASGAAESTVANTSGLTATEIADQTKLGLAEDFAKKYEPIKQGYQDIEPLTKNIEIPSQSRNAISRNIGKIVEEEGLVKGTPERSFVESFADGFNEIDNLDKLKKFRTALGRASGPDTRYVSGLIKEKLDNLELNILKRYGESLPEGEPKLLVADVIQQMGDTKAAYKGFREDMETLGKGFWGKKKIYGYQDFLDKLDEIGPSKFGQKLFNKDNVKFANWFQDNFPEQYKNLAQFKKSELYENATKSGDFNAQTLFRDVNKLQPETKKALFNPEELQKLQDSKLYLDNMKKVRAFNPSDTGTHLNMLNHFSATGALLLSGHPVMAAGNLASAAFGGLGEIRSKAMLKIIKELGPNADNQIGALSKLEKLSTRVTNDLKSKAGAVLDVTKKIPPGVLGGMLAPHMDEHKDRVQTIGDLHNNVDKLYGELNKNSEPLYQHAPNIANSTQAVGVRALQFLNSKIPQEPNRYALSPDYVPSKSEMAEFNQYFKTVEDPTSIMTEIKAGTLTPQSLETIQTVYPKMFAEMQSHLAEALSKKMASKSNLLPFQTKMALSMFMGVPLDASTDPANILSNQVALQGQGQQQALNHVQNQQKVSQTGLSKIDKATMAMTPAQKSNQRLES